MKDFVAWCISIELKQKKSSQSGMRKLSQGANENSKTRENRAQDKVVIALKLKLIGWERREFF